MPEHTIAENLQRLVDAKEDIADAITAKGGTVGANDGLEDFASDIASIPSGGGGGSQPRKDVNFYDYDGTIVNSYTAAEFANLSAMPDNPTHEGLTAQGWNWSLSDAKSYVASYGKLEIGQMYVTSDGKTRLYITLTGGRTSPVLKLYLNANSELDIDWGDGSTHSRFTNPETTGVYRTERHNYASDGDYVIAISVVSGSFILQSSGSTESSTLLSDGANIFASPDRGYNASVYKVEVGNSTKVGAWAFAGFYNLKTVTLPIGSLVVGMEYSFAYTYCLQFIAFPINTVEISDNMFNGSYNLNHVSINNGLNYIKENCFRNCRTLKTPILPNTTSILYSSCFQFCYSFTSIIIPQSVGQISSNSFDGCYSLATITIDKAQGSISGSPWGASTTAPTSTRIIWTS